MIERCSAHYVRCGTNVTDLGATELKMLHDPQQRRFKLPLHTTKTTLWSDSTNDPTHQLHVFGHDSDVFCVDGCLIPT